MHYSIIKPILKEEKVLIDKGSLKTKRKFAFLLEKGDKILIDNTFYVNDEVDIVLDYSTTDSKRPKETITIYTVNDISRE